MTTPPRSEQDAATLDVTLDGSHLPVSALSALLRVLQASLREVARADDSVGEHFARSPEPVLIVREVSAEGDLTIRLEFVDRASSASLSRLSTRAFEAFLEQFGDFVKTLPQPGLWGASTRGARRGDYRSAAEMRMDQVRMELRRFPRSTLRFGGRAIHIEGDQVSFG